MAHQNTLRALFKKWVKNQELRKFVKEMRTQYKLTWEQKNSLRALIKKSRQNKIVEGEISRLDPFVVLAFGRWLVKSSA